MEKTTLYEYQKENFFPKDNTLEYNKDYLINANVVLPIDDGGTTYTGIYFHFCIKRIEDNLAFTIELYSWSNDTQKQTSIENSIWSEKGFGAGKFIPMIVNYYCNIIKNFYLYLDENIRKVSELKELIDKLENPSYSFHYKLLNLLPREKFENFCKKHFNNYPILNLALFEENPTKYSDVIIFIPNYFDGFYINGIEVSVDLDENDFPLIEDDDIGEISNEEFFKRFGIE
jgi:hypothetical protein